MGYIGDLIKIEVSKASDCSYLIVEDITSYPQILGAVSKDREDLGIALFWTDDNWSSSDGDLSNINQSSSWIITSDNNKTYDIKAFVVPVWDEAITYDDDDIVHKTGDNEGFYINDGVGGTTTQIPGVQYSPTTAWSLLDEEDYATFNIQLCVGSGDYGYVTCSETTDCNLFYSRRTGCHEYTITNNSASLTVNSITLVDYDDIVVQSGLSFSGTTLDITIEEDGVYILRINYDDNDGNEQKIDLPIFDMCDTETCVKALIRYVLCMCDDPCDFDCSNGIQKRRDEINKIIALYFAIMGYIYTDTTKYMGAIKFTDTREDYMQQVGRMVEQLKIISERCGLCEDTDNNDCCD